MSSITTDSDHYRLALVQKLQRTLDLHEILSIFFDHLSVDFSLSGIDFSHNTKPLKIGVGHIGAESYVFDLNEHGPICTDHNKRQSFGYLNFSRKEPFDDTSKAELASLSSMLLCPLNNALRYFEAVNQSLCDPLTQIGNRRAMDIVLERELKLARRNKQGLSLLLMDVDNFKAINDAVGHQAGDSLLICVAQLAQKTLRQTDQVFRYGGEEFVILLGDTALNSAVMIAERIRCAIAGNDLRLNNQTVTATVSLGISHYEADDTAENLIERADKALYLAKRHGRNRIMTQNQRLKAVEAS